MKTPRIRLVTFDVLHTLITPRHPIHIQYAEVFGPHLGPLEPDVVKSSFKAALKAVQTDFPAYRHGAVNWWSEVIRRTASGAGADPDRLQESLADIVPSLLNRFSSGEGYMAFEDAIPTIMNLHEAGIRVGVISNGDSRFRSVLEDLGFPDYMEPIALSEEIGIEKPNRAMFDWAISKYNATSQQEALIPEDCLHIGDELQCDYHGALQAGFQTRLLRRPGPKGAQAHKEVDEDLVSVQMIESLKDVPSIAIPQKGLFRY